MQLQRIQSYNIRSLKDFQLTFPFSTMLFYGDVGHGKSSILKSIEFALFGILENADLSGISLLRRGEIKGFVELSFSIGNDSYTIKRTLIRKSSSKGESVQQDSKVIFIHNNVKNVYSPTEARVKILEALGYPVSRYMKANKIPLYRYTVYTPQEEVKEILQSEPAARFEILKEVFDIVRYETILDNIKHVHKGFNAKKNDLEIKVRSIGDPKILIKEINLTLLEAKKKFVNIGNEIKEREKLVRDLNNQLDDIQRKVTEYATQLATITTLEASIVRKKKSINEFSEKCSIQEKKVAETRKDFDNLPSIACPTKATKEEIAVEIKELRRKIDNLVGDKAFYKKKVDDITSLLEGGKCPTCRQDIHEKDRFDKEKEESQGLLDVVTRNLQNAKKTLEEKESLQKSLEQYMNVEKERKYQEKILQEQQSLLDQYKNGIKSAEIELKADESAIRDVLKQNGILDLEAFKSQGKSLEKSLAAKKQDVDIHTRLLNQHNLTRAAIEQEIKQKEESLNLAKSNVDKKENLEKKLNKIIVIQSWIDNVFPELIRAIERELLASTAERFNEHFKKWFNILVQEDNIDIEIRPDDFEPVVIVNGYISPFKDLSGGEKSALSLAYRLALNKTINEKFQETKTKDLLILDEPTDGFSQEQVNRMQTLFEKLGIPQLIIISHERTLDSFVSDIFTFQKKHHETIVNKENPTS